MAERDLKKVFKEAAAIAEVVPESMQDAAFNRALDLLQGTDEPQQRQDRKGTVKVEDSGKTGSGGAPNLAARINRTEHPEIMDEQPVLDRSLMVLRIAKDLGVDGVSAPEVAEILTDTFRIRTLRQNVTTALNDATQLVDRKKVGRGVTYKIMSRGEKFLDDGGTQKAEPAKKTTTSTKRSTKAKASGRKPSKPKTTKKTQAKGGSRPGPKAAIEGLIESDYMKEPRTIKAIEGRLRIKLGHTYRTTDLSPALGRLLRQGKLDRERNAEGQFEYTAK